MPWRRSPRQFGRDGVVLPHSRAHCLSARPTGGAAVPGGDARDKILTRRGYPKPQREWDRAQPLPLDGIADHCPSPCGQPVGRLGDGTGPSLALSRLFAHSEPPLSAQLLGCGSIVMSVGARSPSVRRQGGGTSEMGLLYRRVNHTISRRRAARWCVVLNRARPGLLLDLTWVKRGGHSPSCLAVISSGSCRQLAQHLRAVLENPDLPYSPLRLLSATAPQTVALCTSNPPYVISSMRPVTHAWGSVPAIRHNPRHRACRRRAADHLARFIAQQFSSRQSAVAPGRRSSRLP